MSNKSVKIELDGSLLKLTSSSGNTAIGNGADIIYLACLELDYNLQDIAFELKRLYEEKVNQYPKGTPIIWRGYSCLISFVKKKDGLFKIKANYKGTKPPMPYGFYWITLREIDGLDNH